MTTRFVCGESFPSLVGFQQKTVLFGDFKKGKLENLPKIPIICQNPSTLENDVPQPNRVVNQLVTYTKSNVFYSPSFFILCTIALNLSHFGGCFNYINNYLFFNIGVTLIISQKPQFMLGKLFVCHHISVSLGYIEKNKLVSTWNSKLKPITCFRLTVYPL